MKKKARIAFLGCGYMGQNAHMKNYFEQRDDCEIVALAEARPELGKLVAARYGIPRVFTNYQDMLAGAAFDAVVAPQQFGNHINIVPMVLESGKPLLTEKPVCISYENGLKLAALAEKYGVPHMVAYHKRSDLASEYAKAIINEWREHGEMGKMRLLRVSMPPGDWIGGAPAPLSTDEAYPLAESEPAPPYFPGQLGEEYITFVNYYIHQVNYINFILGEQVHIKYADPTGAVLAASGDSGIPAILEMNAYSTPHDWQEVAFAAFERGYVRVELPAPLADRQPGRVIVYKGAGETPQVIEIELPRVSAMQNQAKNFIAVVRGEKKPPCDSRQAAEDLRVAAEYIRVKNHLEG